MSFDSPSALTPPAASDSLDAASDTPTAADALAASIAEPIIAEAVASATAPAPAPRTRWAGIVWGLVFLAVAALAYGQVADASRRAALGDWAATLTAPAVLGIVVLGIGAMLLIAGLVGLIRRGQVLRAQRRG